MSSVVISGDSSGTVSLTVPSVAGTNTATLPAATGTVMVSGNMPAFSAYLSTQQSSITNSTWTKVTCQTKEFDTASAYDNSTNYRFTPQVAGYYQISGGIGINATTVNPTWSAISIYKNGTSYKQVRITNNTSTASMPTISSLVYLNGSTDYVELFGFLVGATGGDFDAGINYTWFNGSMVRTA